MAARRVIIIDYGSGNLRSCAKAFERVVRENAALSGAEVLVSADASALDKATHIVLPGVGAYADCMKGISSVSGMIEALEKNIRTQQKPFLGICVGMQLLFERGHEHGNHAGLGWLKGEVKSLADTAKGNLKIPHMGWNNLHIQQPHPLMKDIAEGAFAYFVHSYHAVLPSADALVASTEYGGPVTAVVADGNIMGTQFHPEKSQKTGLTLIRNFLML